MQKLSNFFKDRNEVERYFGDKVFEFVFMSDGVMHFTSLEPIFIADRLGRFDLSFFHNETADFFRFSGFQSWLDKFQICDVKWISEEDGEEVLVYSEKYKPQNT